MLLGGEQMLFEILHLDFIAIPPIEIARISTEADDRKRKGEPASIRGILKERAHRPPMDLFDQGLHPGLVKISDMMEALIPLSVEIKVLYERVISGLGISEYASRWELNAELDTFKNLMDRADQLDAGMRPGELVVFLREEMKDWLPIAQQKQVPALEPLENLFVSKRLEKFIMNVSALNNFLQCPLHFYFQNLLRMPGEKSEALGFGSAVHHAVEKLFEKMKSNPGEVFPSKHEMIADFQQYMISAREVFTQESFLRKMAHGEMVIVNYYDTYIYRWKKIVLIESNIRNVMLGVVPLKGKLDKIEFNGSEVNIVDYKTGSFERALKQMERPNEENPSGGNYWRQAVFYHLLVELRPGKPWIPVSIEFDFIEPDLSGKFQKVKFYILPADKATVSQQIFETWANIHRHDFYTGCGKPGCRSCRIARLATANGETKRL